MAQSMEGIAFRRMTRADIPQCMLLKQAASWNQLPENWEICLELRPQGCFVAEVDGKVVGTVTSVDFQGRFSWVGMVLVHPEYRRRGIGRRLMDTVLASLGDCETIRLDATPVGRRLYESLGFTEECTLTRMIRDSSVPGTVPICPFGEVFPMTTEHLPAVIALDARAAGANRGRVLDTWLRRQPRYAFVLVRDGHVAGFCMGSPGDSAENLGPLVAANLADAKRLVLDVLLEVRLKPVLFDVFDSNPELRIYLEQLGFRGQRRFSRMFLGPNRFTGDSSLYWAICCPEIG